MSFAGYVCWNADLIPRVMNTEALQTENSVFLATHHPVRMYRQPLHRTEVREEYDQQRFLKDFLARESYAFVPVLGDAGTGKSHLVRWLALNIQEAENRRIILIPKGGTNLRDVIYRVLSGMEGRQFDKYRERLRDATVGLDEAAARQTLLNNLAVAVGSNGGGVRPREMKDVESQRRDAFRHLESTLPPLLYDPFFREHLLGDGGIVADLVSHIIGSAAVRERRETRRQFTLDDLPLNLQNVHKAAGAAARQAHYELIGDLELQQLAVEWINLHLDEAVGQMLRLGGDDLTRLMREVRAELAVQEVELVLLIEDFAKLQGIERPLLEAVLERPNQPDQKLCVLRTALACTTDYYRGVADTVRDRHDFVVSLDREALSSDGLVTADDFEQFTTRYLNAIRLRNGELDDWFDRRRVHDDNSPAPNACERCPYQDTCHTAFGTAGGAGLYPFNRAALLEMYHRTGASGFNPRLLINDVLKHVIASYGQDIPAGAFPPPALLEAFGGSKLSAEMHRKIASSDRVHTARRKVLVELWGGRQVADLHAGVHEAFRLPPLGIEKQPDPEPDPSPDPTPDPQPDSKPVIPKALEDKLVKLDSWGNGAELDQYLTQELRSLVYDAVENRIDWDAHLLVRSAFAAKKTGPFKNTSVSFHNQATQVGAALVRLIIPGERGSLTDAALVLKGLLLYEHFGHWKFKWGLGGALYLRTYARLLDEWSHSVVEQIRGGFLEKGAWNPVPAAVELLAIGARLVGEPASGGRLLGHQVAALFAPGEAAQKIERGPQWGGLLESFLRNRQILMDLVVSRAAATKGGSTRVQVLDAAQLLSPLRAVQEEWVPREVLPAEMPTTPEYKALRKLQDQFRNGLDAAIDEERTRVLARYARVANALEWEDGIKEIGPVLREAKRHAHKEGVYSGPAPDELERAIIALNKAPLVRWQTAVQTIAEAADDRGLLLAELGQDHEAAARPAEEFVRLAESFLKNSTDKVRRQIEDLEAAGGRNLDECFSRIEEHFRELEELVNRLGLPPALMSAPSDGGQP